MPWHAYGTARAGISPSLRLRGVPEEALFDPVGATGGVAGDEGAKVDGESVADLQRLLLVAAVRERVEGGEGGRGGGTRSGAQIQEREICADLQNQGKS